MKMANIDENKNSTGDISSSADELLRRLNEQYKTDKIVDEMKKTNPDIDTVDIEKAMREAEKDITNDDTQIDMRTLSDDEFKDLIDNYLTSSNIDASIGDSDYKELQRHIVNLQQKSGATLVDTSASEISGFKNKDETEDKNGHFYDSEVSMASEHEEIKTKEHKKSIFARLKSLMYSGEHKEETELSDDRKCDEKTKPEDSYTVFDMPAEGNGGDDKAFEENSTPTEEMLENRVDDTDILSAFEPDISKSEPEEEKDVMMTDTAMMKAFGLDSKNGETSEPDTSETVFDATTYNTVEEGIYEKASATAILEGKAGAGEEEKSYTVSDSDKKKDYVSFDQNKSIFSSYRRKYAFIRIKLIVCAVVAAILLIIENIGIFGVELPAFMQSSAGYAAIEWIFVFVLAILVYDRIIYAAKRLAKFEFTADSLTLVMFFMSVVTSLVALFSNSEEIKMFNLPFAICVLFNLLNMYICVRKEIFTFKIISSQKKKRALTVIKDGKASPEASEFSDYLSDDAEIYKITETEFLDGYFARRNESPKSNKKLRILIPVIFGVSVVFAIISAIVADTGLYESVSNAYLAFLMCAPVSVFLASELPMYLSSVRAYSNGAAIIGDTAPEMLQNMAVVSFSDNDIFGNDGVKIKGVKTVSNNKIESIIYYASSAFSIIGGPLAKLFRQATLDGKVSDDTELRVLSDNGIDSMVDGHHIVVGTPGYMDAQCFKTIYETGDEQWEGRTGKRILYLACDEEIIAKFYIEYNISKDFIYLVKRLSMSGICVSIRTNDPCLDADILYRGKISPEQYPIRMIKGEKSDNPEQHVEAKNTGVVSVGTVKGLVKTLLLCDRINNISRTNFVIKAVSAVIGAVVMAFLIFAGAYTNVWSLYPALYQAFWMLPIYLISKVYI